jgi:hypothetical protein
LTYAQLEQRHPRDQLPGVQQGQGLDDGARQWLKLDSPVLRQFFTDGVLPTSIGDLSDISVLDKVLRAVEGGRRGMTPVPVNGIWWRLLLDRNVARVGRIDRRVEGEPHL